MVFVVFLDSLTCDVQRQASVAFWAVRVLKQALVAEKATPWGHRIAPENVCFKLRCFSFANPFFHRHAYPFFGQLFLECLVDLHPHPRVLAVAGNRPRGVGLADVAALD